MDGFNRGLFIVLGVLLVVIGAAGTLVSLGRVPRVDAATTLLPPVVRNRWHDWGTAAWLVVAAAGLVLAVLAFLLIRAQLLPRAGQQISDLLFGGPDDEETHPGRTRVRSAAVVHSIERDLARHPKVRRVRVDISGDRADPRIHARLELSDECDVTRLQSYVTESLTRFTTTTGLDPTRMQVVLSLTGRGGHRVH